MLELAAQVVVVDQIAVMGHGDLAAPVIDEDGLGVVEGSGPGGGVAGVANSDGVAEALELLGVKDLAYQAETDVLLEPLTVGGYDTGALLPAMLEREQTLKG